MLADPLFDRLARALAGRYTLVRELGRGGMATVYLGTDLKLGRGVAIKLLAPATRAYVGSDRFQREVLLAAQLSHPHIVPMFEADEADGLLFYVMEYVDGESLRQRLGRHGPLSVDDAVRIAVEVGDALQYAHENGVIHRDVKPENILLSRGHALVSDFGIAKLMEERGSSEGPPLTGAGIAVASAACPHDRPCGSQQCAGQSSSGGSCGARGGSTRRPGWCSSRRGCIRWGAGVPPGATRPPSSSTRFSWIRRRLASPPTGSTWTPREPLRRGHNCRRINGR